MPGKGDPVEKINTAAENITLGPTSAPKKRGSGFLMVKNIVKACWNSKSEIPETYLVPAPKTYVKDTQLDRPEAVTEPKTEPPPVAQPKQEETPQKPVNSLFKPRHLWCD